MRGLAREVATAAFAASGLAALARRARVGRGGRFALMLHGVASRRWPALPAGAGGDFAAADLDALLAWLAPRFALLTPEEFLRAEPLSRPGVLLTFDDGLANNVTNALPVLERRRAPAVFFVTLRHVEEPRDWLPATRAMAARGGWREPAAVPGEIARDLYDGMSPCQLRRAAEHPLVTLGSHTLSHPFLTRLADAELERELAVSKARLEELAGRPVELFAYPTGDYDRRVVAATAAAGYRAAFADRRRGAGPPAFEIPRVGIYAARPAYLAAKLSGLHRPPLRRAPL